jgi:hypothetical protein
VRKTNSNLLLQESVEPFDVVLHGDIGPHCGQTNNVKECVVMRGPKTRGILARACLTPDPRAHHLPFAAVYYLPLYSPKRPAGMAIPSGQARDDLRTTTTLNVYSPSTQ